MRYIGKLYGKVGSKTFDLGKTSEDWDNLEKENNALITQLSEKDSEIEGLKQWKKEQMLVWNKVDDFVRPMCSLGESVSNKTFDLLNETISEKQKSQMLYKALIVNVDCRTMRDSAFRKKHIISSGLQSFEYVESQSIKAIQQYESTHPGDYGTKQDSEK